MELIFSEPTPRFTGVCDRCDTPQQVEDIHTRRASIRRACVACGASVTVKRIHAKYSDSNCNAECVTATGNRCSCSCRGEQHGTGWTPVVKKGEYVPTDDVIKHRNRAASRREAADRKAREQRAAELAERRRAFEEWAEEHHDVIEYVNEPGHTWGFVLDMAERLGELSTLTPRQVDVVRRSIERDKQREAARLNASPVPTGRVEVTGRVVHVKRKRVQRGYTDAVVYTLIVESPDGWKVWLNSPKGINEIVYADLNYNFDKLLGERVSFTATVKASDEDRSFGFATRPTKARVG